MLLADYHVHSDFSSDSTAPAQQMVEQAVKLGLEKLCITDHMDYDYPQESGYSFVFDPDKYMDKLEELKRLYHKKIELKIGIELGLQPCLAARNADLTRQYPFDFIIGSSHLVDRMDPYTAGYWENRTVFDGIHRYFESVIENCKAYQGFHIYGHLDYIIRYVPKEKVGQKTSPTSKYDYSYLDYSDLLDEVLRTIISYGKGIEINTAGLKYGLGYPHPKPEILKRYRELGGELITIGSDAHKPEHLCYDFHLIPELLKSLGYKYYATFAEGKPSFEKL
ncbi:MAG TPA: histidinol-phosphatase HisJ family protein [Clostridiales bacterium]|nr:histidinol-phosphatase HisJ family protein [Clostridiales bacterium]